MLREGVMRLSQSIECGPRHFPDVSNEPFVGHEVARDLRVE